MKKFLKILGFSFLGLIILFIIIGSSDDGNTSTTSNIGSQQAISEPKEPDYIVSVQELADEFENNSLSASQKYEDKLVRVSGVTGNIDTDILGTPYVIVHDPADEFQFDGVQCMFDRKDTNQLTSLSKGERITVEGYLADEVILNILVRNCQIVQ